jgi:hypothetical protein
MTGNNMIPFDKGKCQKCPLPKKRQHKKRGLFFGPKLLAQNTINKRSSQNVTHNLFATVKKIEWISE